VSTCDGKHYASKGDPALMLVALEEAVNVVGVERLEDGRIILADVVQPNEGDADEPQRNGGRKAVPHFVSSKSLHAEQNHQDRHRHPHHHICTSMTGQNLDQTGKFPVRKRFFL